MPHNSSIAAIQISRRDNSSARLRSTANIQAKADRRIAIARRWIAGNRFGAGLLVAIPSEADRYARFEFFRSQNGHREAQKVNSPPGRPFTQDGPAREASVITAKYNCHTETLIKIGGWQKQALWNDNGSWINGSEYN